MSYTLIYNRPEEHAPYSAIESLEICIEDERTLPEMLDAFKAFLLATGYMVNGDIVIEEFLADSEEWQ